MGEVWEAHDRERDVRVALKTIVRATPEHVLRLKQEFRIAQSISHPNVVSLGELFHHEGAWFFSMELIEGVGLLDHVRPGGRLAADRLRACLAQLLDAVDALHAAGVLHRDLKPSNVMVDRDGRLVLLDLGLVAVDGEQALDDRAVIGTAAYMAPEQAAGSALGPPADWYGVGAILYHALAGRPPFEGDHLAIMFAKQRALPTPPPASDDVPGDLARLCMSLLAIDPRARPDPRTSTGGARRDRTGSASLEQSGRFVGRERELAELARAVATSRAGATVVVITGESGVGKSALVRRFAAQAEAVRDAVILGTRCHEHESVPGVGIDGIMDALAAHLRRLDDDAVSRVLPRRVEALVRAFPVMRTVRVLQRTRRVDDDVIDPHTRRARVIEAIAEVLARIADRQPLVVAIDDIQWADAETISILEGVVGAADPPCLLLIATWRSVDTGAALPPLLAAAPRLDLEPLSTGEAMELARELLAGEGRTAGDAAADAADLARESGGHPLLLDMLVEHYYMNDARRTLGVSLRDAVVTRVQGLDPEPRALLEAVAVAGAPIGERILARVSGLGPVRVARALAALRTARLIRRVRRDEVGTVEVYHHQVALAVLALLDPVVRRALHAGFADALEAGGDADPDLLAAHLQAAGDLEAAARYAVAAATAAASAVAFHKAVRLWGLAIELGGAGRLDECQLGRADALVAIGRGADAAADLLAVASRSDAATALELRRHAAQQLLVTGHTAEGLEQIREVLALEGLGYPASSKRAVLWIVWRRLRLRLGPRRFRPRDQLDLSQRMLARVDVCWHVALGLSIVDTMRGHAFHALGLRLARSAGEPHRYARALALDIAYQGTSGGPVTAAVEAQFHVAHQLASQLGDHHARGLAIGCRGVAAFLRGDWRDGATWCHEAEQIFAERCAGVSWELATAKLFAGRSMLAMGELVDLAARVDADIRDCRGRGDLYGETSLRGALLPFVHLVRDDLAAARQAADEALARWVPVGYQIQHYYQLVSRANVGLYDGVPDVVAAAGAALADGTEAARRSMFMRVQVVRVTLAELGGRFALAAIRPDLARAGRAAAGLDRERLPWSDALASALRAGIAHHSRRPDEARAALERAVAGFDGAHMALHAAAARRRLAALSGGAARDELRVASDAWMASQKVADPARITAMLIPW